MTGWVPGPAGKDHPDSEEDRTIDRSGPLEGSTSGRGQQPGLAPWFRFGYVLPHLYVDMDAYQFYKVAPDGVMLVTTSLDLADYERQSVESVVTTLWDRVDLLADARVDWISLSGVPLGAAMGRSRTLELVEGLHQRAGVPASTDIESHVNALRHLGVSKVALATRWPDDVVNGIVAYLSEAGLEVTNAVSHPRSLAANKSAMPADDRELAIALGRRAVTGGTGAQAVLLPGGLWFAVHAALRLEEELGIPVLINITSALWEALHLHPEPLEAKPSADWGALLQSL